MNDPAQAMTRGARPLWSKCLGASSLALVVLETLRASNAIVHVSEFGGVSFVGVALPAPLVAVGGPLAATLVLLGVGLSWERRRAGYGILLGFAALFLVTHVLDQARRPGPPVWEIGRISGLLPAWLTMLWAWASVVVAALAGYALATDRPGPSGPPKEDHK